MKTQNTSKKQIKMNLVWWVCDVTEESFYNHNLIKILCKKYDIVYSKNPDYIIVDVFNEIYNAGFRKQIERSLLDYDCVRIFCTGENVRADYNLVDYAIDYDFVDFGDRHLRYPCFAQLPFVCNDKKRNLTKREKFCSYMVSHSGAYQWGSASGLRDRFFDKLSTYKRVDSGGSWRNNIGGMIDNHYKDDWVANKRRWLQDYKFNLCFENSSYAGYLTEKLFDAYSAGCVPIYWGDTSFRSGESFTKTDNFDIGGGLIFFITQMI